MRCDQYRCDTATDMVYQSRFHAATHAKVLKSDIVNLPLASSGTP